MSLCLYIRLSYVFEGAVKQQQKKIWYGCVLQISFLDVVSQSILSLKSMIMDWNLGDWHVKHMSTPRIWVPLFSRGIISYRWHGLGYDLLDKLRVWMQGKEDTIVSLLYFSKLNLWEFHSPKDLFNYCWVTEVAGFNTWGISSYHINILIQGFAKTWMICHSVVYYKLFALHSWSCEVEISCNEIWGSYSTLHNIFESRTRIGGAS